MPEQLLSQLTSSDVVALGVGMILLVFGRKLFWLSLGGLGFFFGLWVTSQMMNLSAGPVALLIALFAGLGCAVLALVAQKLAVVLGGMVLGGTATLWVASFFEASLHGQSQMWLVAIALVGAVIGAAVVPSLFETSLAATTSVVGAMLIVSGASIGQPHETWLFVVLALIGLVLQTRSPRRQVRTVRIEQAPRRARA